MKKITFLIVTVTVFLPGLFCFQHSVFAASSIVINEVVVSGAQRIPDEDGDKQDWLELYNKSGASINLSGMYLSDDTNDFYKWPLPNMTLGAGKFLVIFCSGKNKIIPNLHTNFGLSAGESVMLFDEDDGLLDEVTYDQTASIPNDQALGRIPNGTGAFKSLLTATPGAANQDNPLPPTPNPNAQYIKINEVVTSNSTHKDEDGNTGDWIELYNTSGNAINMNGLYIGDNGTKWQFPSVTIAAHGYLIVWADSTDNTTGGLHTNFNISSNGEPITLYNTDGTTVEDTVSVGAIEKDHSYGRIPNGTGAFKELVTTTPLAANQDNATTPDPNPNAQYIKINEVVIDNVNGETDPAGKHGDWIELYNTSGSAINMEGLFIVDSGQTPWEFPAVTIPAGGYLVVWADSNASTNGELHTGFGINKDGEIVTLYNTDGTTVVDQVDVEKIATDHSYGRIANGTGAFKELDTPTFGAANQDNSSGPELNPNAHYIKINEIVSDNKTGMVDEDSAAGDWIELYNTSATAINMEGLFIGDGGDPWEFPAVTIPAGGYLVVWADSKDRTGSHLHTNFEISSKGEKITLYNTDGTTVEDEAIVTALATDDSYGRYPNGTGDFMVMTHTTPGDANVIGSVADLVTINEVSADWEDVAYFHDEDNTAQDWIELYNTSSNITVNLAGLKICDSNDTWIFPNVSIAPQQYLILFASSKNRRFGELHTNFRIESDGETLRLLDADDRLIQRLVVPQMNSNHSYGHYPNGTGAYQIFDSPTPGVTNDGQDATPPVTTLDYYDDEWHTSDVIITLAATDEESGVKETYYMINGGTVEAVGAAGQPVIATEGADNTLEYWSVDNAGNEELPHKILTDIKLDKTPPVVTITSPAKVESFDAGPITVEGTVTDTISGVDSLQIDVGGYLYYATVQDDHRFTVTNVEITDGANSITARGTDLASNTSQDTATAFLGWLMHLEIPYSETQNYYSGAACAHMILNFIRDGVGSALTQQDVYNYGHPFNYAVNASLNEMDPKAMDYALGHFDPYDTSDSSGQGDTYKAYNFAVESFANTDFAKYLRDIIHWMAYPVKIDSWWLDGPLTAHPNVPPAAPAYGTYDHWVIINGAATSQNPAPEPTTNPSYTPDFTVYGLWLTDPATDGIGQDLYVTAQDAQTYFVPVVSQDSYNGKLVHVAEPPEAPSDATVEIAESRVNEENGKAIEIIKDLTQRDTSGQSEFEARVENAKRHLYDRALVVDLKNDGKVDENRVKSEDTEDLLGLVFNSGSEAPVELDWKNIVDPSLLSDEKFKEAFDGSQVREFIKVRRTDKPDSYYYLIPFDKYVKGQFLTCAAIIIDAKDGSFRQASWSEEPARFIEITKDKALGLLLEKYPHLENVALGTAELAWAPQCASKSPFYPYWRISFGNDEVYCINQNGEVTSDV